MDDDSMILLFIGSVAAVVIGFFIFSTMSTGRVKETLPVTMNLTAGLPTGSATNPSGYYQDLKPAQATVPYEAIVQNEEKITWTDWLGRERVISISRMVH